ncbi:hypothetical protein FJZ23_01525 [Candidatus Parcubacteria bacterium]|nr:hypothetical protein [Candidatus Parcubacteria bacterium]
MIGQILFHRTMFPVLFLAAFLLNTYVFLSPPLGLVLLALYFVVYGREIGQALAPQEKGPIGWWIGTVILLGVVLIFLTVAYYIASVPKELIQVLILLTPPLSGMLASRAHGPSLLERFHAAWQEQTHRISRSVFWACALILLFAAVIIQTVRSSAITEAVRSPWERLDLSVLALFSLAILLLCALAWRGRERALILSATSVVLFVFLSLALFAFPLGYGFDPFIHRATEAHIAEFGTITPKPLYYIGQYALVLFVHHGFLVPIDTADAFLVPLLAAILLPLGWYSAALHITKKRQIASALIPGLFLIPLAPFIVTTPQGLANLFTLLLVLASVPYLFENERPRLWLPGVLAVSALAVHPIAGLPALLYFALLCTDPDRAPLRAQTAARWVSRAIILIGSMVLPASFLANAALSGQALSVNWAALNPLTLLSGLPIRVFFQNQFSPLLDLVYLYGRNAFLLVGVVALFGWMHYRRELTRRARIPLWIALALLINYLLMKTAIGFDFLIDYERQNYADRLVPLMAYFVAPLFLLGLSHLFVNLRERATALRAFAVVLIAACAVSAFYLAYPRRDAYETSRAFNTSASDFAAVRAMETWAAGEPYLVLANQSVSAAAIREIGFRYYGGVFFYPIPTGEPLYEQFLAMNASPSRETAKRALALAPMHGDISTLFFAVNDYWWDAPRIIETAKTTADSWQAVGTVHIFRYQL